MPDNFQRKYRTTPITDEEHEEDERVRALVMAECPPAKPKDALNSSSQVASVLREAIAADGDIETLAQKVNLSPNLLHQFVAGQRDIRLSTLEKLAAHFGLKVVAVR